MTKDEARAALTLRQAQLAEQDAMSAEGREPVTLQQDAIGRLSRIDAMQVQAMQLATENRRKQERKRINAALIRLDGDDWGWCATCGEEIAEGRLRNDPAVSICIGCARGEA